MEFYSLISFSIVIFIIPSLRKMYFGQGYKQEGEIIKKRILFFDFLKGLAIWAVILIHVAYFFDTYPFSQNNNLFLYLLNNLARFAIPVFVISSGILLNPLKEKKETAGFYWRKIWRIFLPYLICTVIYAFVRQLDFSVFLYNLITGKAEIPYYFIIVLLELYLIYPLLYKYKESNYLLPIAFILSLLACFTPALYEFYGFPLFFQMIFFFCYGICLRDKFLGSKINKQEAAFWLSIIILYTILTIIKPEWYYNVRLFYGLAMFNLFFYFKDKINLKNLLSRLVVACGRNSLWLYLVHFVVVEFVYNSFKYLPQNYYLKFVIIYAVSLTIIIIAAQLARLIYDFFIINLLKFKTSR